jgi:predicted O-methyltransferase YrrM
MEYKFTNKWFRNSTTFSVWEILLREWKPEHIMEIGCYEGQCTTYMIEQNDWSDDVKLWAVDTWEGSMEHTDVNMSDVEKRFDSNIKLAKTKAKRSTQIIKEKTYSHRLMSAMMDRYEGKFDLIYVDGSHTAPDVLLDATLAFKLIRPGGVIIFDDWHWKPWNDERFDNPNNTPKVAIDTFVNIHWDKLSVINIGNKTALDQLFIKKNM